MVQSANSFQTAMPGLDPRLLPVPAGIFLPSDLPSNPSEASASTPCFTPQEY